MELHATLGAGVHMGECWGSFVPVVALRRGVARRVLYRGVCAAWLVGGGLRGKVLPARVVCVWTGKKFSLLAANGLKWVFLAVLGEFCTGCGHAHRVRGEFCTAPVCGAVRGRDMSAPRPAFDLHPARTAGHPAQWAHSPGCDSPLPLAGEGEVHQEQVEGDDDGCDEETCDTQGAIVDVVAHDLTVCGQAHEWDDREGDAE